jgi:tetratricopeptide (TPR) repeat protein/class 3 adenylate cyclase
MAPRDIPAGADWVSAIVEAIEDASRLLLVLSESSNRSPQVRRELEQAVSLGVPIVAVRMEEVELSKWMRYFISSHQWYDALHRELEPCLEDILDVLKAPTSSVTADLSNLSAMMEGDIRRLESTIDRAREGTSRLQPGERRRVAVLSLRLAGLTEQGDTLLPRAMVSVLGTVEAMVGRVVRAFGGYLTKPGPLHFRCVFGAKVAREDDSHRAVSSAERLLKGLEELKEVLSVRGIELDHGLGASAGLVEVVTDESGEPTTRGEVLEAAKSLADPAEGNDLLVTETVFRDCGNSFRFERVETSSPKRAYRLVAPAAPHGRVPVSGVDKGPFVGRERELAELRDAILGGRDDAGTNRRGGARHIVLGIGGEAGVGKSRLVEEVIGSFDSSTDAAVLWGRARSSAQPPYFLWRTLLENLLYEGQAPRIDYPTLLGRLRGMVEGDRVPFLAEIMSIDSGDPRIQELDDRALALETTTAVRDLVGSVASSRRTVLVLDDLHWMGETCRKVLEFLVANCDTPSPITFVLLYRPERDSGDPVRIDIHPGYAELEEVRLRPLEKKHCVALLREILRARDGDIDQMDDRLADIVLKKSGGNPYFLREMVLDLLESGAVSPRDGRWVFEEAPHEVLVPGSLTSLLQSRLDRLPREWRGVLQRASVLGAEFPMRLLDTLSKRVLGTKVDREVLSGLEGKGLLSRESSAFESRCRFSQLLLRDTAYESITDRNRKILHTAAAECIEELDRVGEGGSAELLAYHWERAGRMDLALDSGMESLGKHVRSSQADRVIEIAEKLEQWLKESTAADSNDERMVEVLLARADALDLRGKRTEQESELRRALEIADRLGAEETRARVRERLGWLLMNKGRSREAMEAYEGALELARSAGARQLEGRIVGGMFTAHRQEGRLDRAERCVGHSLEIAREVDDSWSERRNLGNMGILHRDQGRFADAIECFERSLELARKTGSRRDEGVLLGNLGSLYREYGRTETALKRLDQAMQIAVEIGSRGTEGIALGNMGVLYDQIGQQDKAEECHLRSLEIRREVGNKKGEGIALGNLGTLCMKQNRLSEADSYYRQSLDVAREIGARSSEGITYANLGILRRKQGRLEEAEECCRKAMDISRQTGARRSVALTMGSMGYIHLLKGRGSQALECYQRVCDMINQLGLGSSEFEELLLLRDGLLDSGVPEREMPWPDHWPKVSEVDGEV